MPGRRFVKNARIRTPAGTVGDEPRYRLPDEVVVPVSELADAITRLEDLIDLLDRRSERALAGTVDAAIALLTRWLWPLLRGLDDTGDQ